MSSTQVTQASCPTRREWFSVFVIAVAVALLLFVPYALGYTQAHSGTEYTGLMITVEDASYVSSIGKGYNGEWLYHLPFTSEEHAPAFIEVFYLSLGHIARVLNLPVIAMWHLARVVSDVLLFLVTFGFIATFIPAPIQRRAAYLLAIFGGGFDWAWLPWEHPDPIASAVPLDLRMPEAHLFFSALTFPHFAAAISFILITFSLALRALDHATISWQRWLFALGASVGNLLVMLVYPFLIVLMLGVLGAYYVLLITRAWRLLWREAFLLISACALPVPMVLYYQSVLATNDIFRRWNVQATTLSPNPLHYLLAYAPYLVLGALTFRRLKARDHHRLTFLWIWIGAVAVLVYSPLNAQRRFVEGVQVPLAIVATLGLFEVGLPWLARRRVFNALAQRPSYSGAGLQRLLVVGLIAVTSLANLYLWAGAAIKLSVTQPYPLFRPRAELQAMDWLRDHATPDELVLSSYWTGSYIPFRTGHRVFVGNRYETIQFDGKRATVQRFFSTEANDAWRVALLKQYRVAYIFVGRDERTLGDFDPARAEYLKPAFTDGEVTIYRVMTR